jgi:ribonucleoside-diphosphate reductase alpha chain
LLAIAPTVSNSTISGGWSAGVEPIAANIYAQKSAKGTFIRKNRTLEAVLEAKGKNTSEVWSSILEQNGSVLHLDFLTEEEKQVFLTAREINQHAIVKQAIQRQKWVDQAQSINLFFAANSDPKYLHEVHVEAWKGGLKTLYYCRSSGVLKGELASRGKDECASCEG